MSDALIFQVIAVLVVIGLATLPYFGFSGARKSVAFCMKLALAEATLLAAWYIFGSAIVTPVTLPIVFQGIVVGTVFAVLVLGGWIAFQRLKGGLNG